MRRAGVDLLLVSSPENIYYLTGYRTTGYYVYQIFLLPLEGTPQFVTSRLEHTNLARSWIKTGLAIPIDGDPLETTLRAVEATGAVPSRVGYEERGFWLPPMILDGLRERCRQARYSPSGAILERCRAVKSPAEIDCIRRAAGVASNGVQAGIDAVAPGRTENRVAGVVYQAMQDAGGEYSASPVYVVAGERIALAHMTSEGHEIQLGELVYFEVGGCYRRYSGSIMRMVSVGAPSGEATRIATTMLDALAAMIETIRPGVISSAVDGAGRSLVEAAGLGEYWRHRAGYSLGVAFPPGWGEGLVMDIAPGNERALEPGMVFHLVPFVTIPGWGGMGFSETVLVTEDGHEVLTDVPRELVVRP